MRSGFNIQRANTGRAGLIVGIFFLVCMIALIIHDAEFLFTGKTVDLNEVLKNGGELPRGKYVVYTCDMPLDCYGYSQDRYGGIIPVGRKSYNYSMLDKSGMIFSAKVNNNKIMDGIDAVGKDETESITLKGCLTINSSEMDRYLEESCNGFNASFSDENGDEQFKIYLTSYVIDTTKTRLSIALFYTAGIAFGVFCLIIYFKRKAR